jgi:hypothetical protein
MNLLKGSKSTDKLLKSQEIIKKNDNRNKLISKQFYLWIKDNLR